METISLQKTLPNVFSESDVSGSEIWCKNAELKRGQFYLISAQSGKGKTSLMDFIYCRRKDYAGSILFDGQDVKTLTFAQKQKIRQTQLSSVFQGFRLFGELTAMENIEIKNKLTQHKTKEEISAMFSFLGISEKIDKPLKYLSFGQQQRVAIIRALCQPFCFLMIDEAFSHLDSANTAEACKLISDEVKRQNASLIVASLGDSYGFTYDKKITL